MLAKKPWVTFFFAVVSIAYFGGILVWATLTVTPKDAPISVWVVGFFGLYAGRVWISLLPNPKVYRQIHREKRTLYAAIYFGAVTLTAIVLATLAPQLVVSATAVLAVACGAYSNYRWGLI